MWMKNKMLSIVNIFSKDISLHFEIKKNIENEAKGLDIPLNQNKHTYRASLEDSINHIKQKISAKLNKIEFYVVGISFIILTGLVTNQLYTSSIFSLKECSLSWIGFFFGHIFVVASFVLLVLFGREIAKSFMFDDALKLQKEFLIVPAFMIPIFSQINSAMIDINCSSETTYTQVGFSSIVVGVILVRYVIIDLIWLDKEIKPILSYVKKDEFFSDKLSVCEL